VCNRILCHDRVVIENNIVTSGVATSENILFMLSQLVYIDILLLYRIYIAPFSYKSARSKALYIRTFDVSQIRIHFATLFQKKSIKTTQLYYKTTLLYYKYYVKTCTVTID